MLGLVLPAHDAVIDAGGRQHQPELAEVTYIPAPEPAPDDLGLLDDDDVTLPLPLPHQLDPRLQGSARLAALDPDDGISL
jgi:type IV secretion system protein VirD4